MQKNKTLIVYESKQGASKGAAEKIADVLRAKFGLDVDVFDLKKEKDIPPIEQYQNIVVGTGVRGGRVYGKALNFLKKDLSSKRVAFFTSSSWGGTPGSYENAKTRFVNKTLSKYPNLNPVGAEAFGGRIRYFGKTMLDNTDAAKVEVWAEELGKKFSQ
jgi:menaquinone-dependent protoporphyrinogen IX oxidase